VKLIRIADTLINKAAAKAIGQFLTTDRAKRYAESAFRRVAGYLVTAYLVKVSVKYGGNPEAIVQSAGALIEVLAAPAALGLIELASWATAKLNERQVEVALSVDSGVLGVEGSRAVAKAELKAEATQNEPPPERRN
jgi:hypothetical protein